MGNFEEKLIKANRLAAISQQVGFTLWQIQELENVTAQFYVTDTTTQFIDASGEAYFKKETNTNVLTDKHIEEIMQAFDSKADIEHFARSVPFEEIATNDYNLSVSSYVEAKDNREEVDIIQLNAELKTTVARIDQLRKDIDAIVAEIDLPALSVRQAGGRQGV